MKSVRKWCFSIGVLPLLLGTAAFADTVETTKVVAPKHIEGAIRVESEQVIEIIESKEDVVVIDSRVESDRRQGFIEGSIGLPNTETNCESLGKYLAAKDTPAIFYCNGERCGRSGEAVNIALACGYKEIYWFRNGIEEWVEKSFPLTFE